MRPSLAASDEFSVATFPLVRRPLGLTDDGIVLGGGSILVRMAKTPKVWTSTPTVTGSPP